MMRWLTDGAREPGTAPVSAVPARLGRCEVAVLCGAGLNGAACSGKTGVHESAALVSRSERGAF